MKETTKRKKNTKKTNSKRRKKRKSNAKLEINKSLIVKIICAVILVVIVIVGINNVRSYFAIPLSQGEYEIKGVDLSAYQGDVDWDALSKEGMAFAFVKATEGSGFVDKKFKTNWEKSKGSNVYVGAYHFLSFETSGEEQAKNFTSNVKKRSHMLPPVIDVELYGTFTKKHPDAQTVYSILEPMMAALKKEYGVAPILYTNTHFYDIYLKGRYKNDIWISDPSLKKSLSDGKTWTFCQYSFEGVIKGYSGNLKHIDLNVFNGNRRQFYKYVR